MPSGYNIIDIPTPSYRYNGDIRSEVPLSEQVVEGMSEQESRFRKFSGKKVPMFVYDDEKVNGYYLGILAAVSSGSLDDPDFKGEGLVVHHHELCHGLFSSLSMPSKFRIAGAYFFLDEDRFIDHEMAEDSGFRIFDESTHLPEQIRSPDMLMLGHPYDNESEFFASAITTMRYFPDQFIEYFGKLDAKTRQMARLGISSVLAALESVNPDVEKMLPRYRDFRLLTKRPFS